MDYNHIIDSTNFSIIENQLSLTVRKLDRLISREDILIFSTSNVLASMSINSTDEILYNYVFICTR